MKVPYIQRGRFSRASGAVFGTVLLALIPGSAAFRGGQRVQPQRCAAFCRCWRFYEDSHLKDDPFWWWRASRVRPMVQRLSFSFLPEHFQTVGS